MLDIHVWKEHYKAVPCEGFELREKSPRLFIKSSTACYEKPRDSCISFLECIPYVEATHKKLACSINLIFLL